MTWMALGLVVCPSSRDPRGGVPGDRLALTTLQGSATDAETLDGIEAS